MNPKTKLGAKMAQIRALLDKAETTTFPEEAATYRAKAEELMRQYRIEEEDLIADDPSAVEPVLIEVDVCDLLSPYRQNYTDLLWYCTFHNGVRFALRTEGRGERGHVRVAMMVGYETDCRYAEFLFTAARLVFSARLEPQVDEKLSEAENIYRLRSAGIERVRISEMMWGNRDKANLAKVGRVYKAECDRRGEEPALSGRGVTGSAYRESYAEQFVSTFYGRLRAARDAADSVGGGLVLHGREERVAEAFYARFPSLRPSSLPAVKKECEECKRTKHPSGKCKGHRPAQTSAKDLDAMLRRQSSVAARNGRAAGAGAARQVEIQRGHESARRMEPGNGAGVSGAIGT